MILLEKLNELNERQIMFLNEYILSGQAAKSYKKVYQKASNETAKVNASKLLKKDICRQYIKENRERVQDENILTYENILNEIKSIALGEKTFTKIYNCKGELVEKEVPAGASEQIKALALYSKLAGYEDEWETVI